MNIAEMAAKQRDNEITDILVQITCPYVGKDPDGKMRHEKLMKIALETDINARTDAILECLRMLQNNTYQTNREANNVISGLAGIKR